MKVDTYTKNHLPMSTWFFCCIWSIEISNISFTRLTT